MTRVLSHRSLLIAAAGLVGGLLAGCASYAGDGGGYYGGDGGVAIGLDYYEPYGGYYGGWGSGYRVGPVRDGGRGPGRAQGGGAHAFRAAPMSHATPSIPAHAGGGRGR